MKSLSIDHGAIRTIVNRLFLAAVGGDKRPRFAEPYAVFPSVRRLEDDFANVQAEVDTLLAQRRLTKYAQYDPLRAAEVSENWRLYYAYILGVPNDKARADCPRILAFAESTPAVVNAMIAVLEPGVGLAAHKGPYAGILRYHLGLRIPKHNPPSIRVDDERYTWAEGKSIVLDDSFEHEALNESDEPRVVLIVDFRRPMPIWADWLNRYCLRLKRKWSDHFIAQSNGDI